MTQTTKMTIGPKLTNDEREFRLGKAVAYGSCEIEGDDGEATYSLSHAPTQADFDAVAAWLDTAGSLDIQDAMNQGADWCAVCDTYCDTSRMWTCADAACRSKMPRCRECADKVNRTCPGCAIALTEGV